MNDFYRRTVFEWMGRWRNLARSVVRLQFTDVPSSGGPVVKEKRLLVGVEVSATLQTSVDDFAQNLTTFAENKVLKTFFEPKGKLASFSSLAHIIAQLMGRDEDCGRALCRDWLANDFWTFVLLQIVSRSAP